MRTTRWQRPAPLALAAALAAAAFSLSACGEQASSMPGMDMATPSAAPSTAPSTGGIPAVGPHNANDVMFAQMMIPHHQQAVQMSDIVLAKSDLNPDVAKLAEQIKAAQAPEITQLTGWLTGWGESTSAMPMDHGSGHGMGEGMLTSAQIDALRAASGTEAAKLFLTGMTGHHEGAIAMAETELKNGQNEDAKALARQIIETQNSEITTMTTLLGKL